MKHILDHSRAKVATTHLMAANDPRQDQLCLCCGKPFVFGPKSDPAANVYSIDGKKEVGITQTCERCFDDLMADDDEEEVEQEPASDAPLIARRNARAVGLERLDPHRRAEDKRQGA